MLNKVSGLARLVAIVLAIVAGFVVIPNLNVALVLLLLGIVAGIGMPREMQLPAMVVLIVYPIVGAALGLIPAIGANLTAVAGNLQTGLAGGIATAIAMRLFEQVKMIVGGFSGSKS